ncbi:MAG: GIY-YIG nuclease family protein [Candidatus Komeilibacteria bacterium]|nr:GIY-YIG nuclease family protein [Candidatus Komeilibacteria bacterium]
MKEYWVYILASQRNGTLYIGMTGDLLFRVELHKNKIMAGFTKKYNVTRLVYYESFDNPTHAIIREKQLKKWKRQWKLKLIEENNPNWTDLYDDFVA